MRIDAHHILFDRNAWESRPQALRLRSYPLLIPRMDRSTHDALHREVPSVPLLTVHGLDYALRNFECGNTTFQTVDNLLSTIEASSRHPKAGAIERELDQVVLHALEAQVPYLRDGVVRSAA